MLFLVRLFLLLAGVGFSHGRQIIVAYLAAAIAATFIVATGDANGGPPNFESVPSQWLGATVAACIEWTWLVWRQQRGQTDERA
jgi:hypothetical protein